MKILHVGPVNSTNNVASGVNQSIRGSITAQAAIGIEVGLLSSSPTSSGISKEELPGVCLIGGCNRRHYNPWFVSRKWIEQIRKEFGVPDVVIFHSTYIPFQIALGRKCRQLGWRYIVTPHGGMNAGAQNVKKTKRFIANTLFFRSFVKHAVAIHAKSESSARQVQSLFAVKQVFTVPNAVDENLFSISKHLPAANLGTFADDVDLMLGFVGRINVHHKGLDLLLEAMGIIKSQSEENKIKLFMIGPFFTEGDKKYVLSTIKSLCLENVVKLCGPKFDQEKWSYFLACDVFVHTSRFEAGIPLAIIEAMALGCPCLATPQNNMTDVVRRGVGWECQPDPESIAEAIMSIYEKRDSLKALGQRSQELIRTQFTWRNIAEQTRDEYAKLL